MPWTRERRDLHGRYWFRGRAGHEVIDLEVIRLGHDEHGRIAPAASFGFQKCVDLDKFVGYWFGPLEPPAFGRSESEP